MNKTKESKYTVASGEHQDTRELNWNRNMEALQIHYPEMARKIENEIPSDNYELRFESKSEVFNVYIRRDGTYYYPYENTIADVRNSIQNLRLKNTRIAVFLGMGLGYELSEFIKNEMNIQNTSFVIIFEKDMELFRLALEVSNLSAVIANEKFRFYIGEEHKDIFPYLVEYFRDVNKLIFIKAIQPIYYASAMSLYREYYMGVLKSLKEAVIYARNYYGNSPEDSLTGIENMFENINEILKNPGVNLLFNQFQEKPAIVVSTGPSLNKNKHLLKKIQDKAVIICADSALQLLLKEGIKPHFVTMLERDYGLHTLIEGVNPEEVEEVYFSACPVIHNRSYQVYPGPRMIVYRNFNHFKWLEVDRGVLDIKMSAGNMSFKLAEALGCDPIILVGQDLSYGEEGTTHASGHVFGETAEEELVFGSVYVKGNYQEKVRSHEAWVNFLRGYEVDIAGYHGTCVNSTEGGAYIEGTTIMDLQKSIDQYMKDDIDVRDTIKKRFSAFHQADVTIERDRVKEKINLALDDLYCIMESCNKGIEIYRKNQEQLQGYLDKEATIDQSAMNTILQMKDEIILHKDDIMTRVETFQNLLMHVVQSFYIDFEIGVAAVPQKHENRFVALADQLLKYEVWYHTIHQIANIVYQSVLQAKQKIESEE